MRVAMEKEEMGMAMKAKNEVMGVAMEARKDMGMTMEAVKEEEMAMQKVGMEAKMELMVVEVVGMEVGMVHEAVPVCCCDITLGDETYVLSESCKACYHKQPILPRCRTSRLETRVPRQNRRRAPTLRQSLSFR